MHRGHALWNFIQNTNMSEYDQEEQDIIILALETEDEYDLEDKNVAKTVVSESN